MNQLDKIKQEELQKQIESSVKVGMMYFDRRGDKIIRVTEIVDRQWREDTPITTYYCYDELVNRINNTWKSHGSSAYQEFSRNYDLTNPIKDLSKLYEEALNIIENGLLNDVEEEKEVGGFSTELVALHSKENLTAMVEGIEVIKNKKIMLQRMINYQLEEQKQKFDMLKSQLNKQLSILQKKVEKIMRVITVLELYLGIEEELFQLQAGESADVNEPLTLRQQILYMDEEVGIIEDQGIDWSNIEQFDEWLLQDGHYKILLPEKKSIVVFKPRRHGKHRVNSRGELFREEDPRNSQPYFLIRNGENLYRIFSSKMTLPARLFPRRKEFEEILNKMQMEEGKLSTYDQEKIEDTTYLYQRIVFLFQGLLDRTDILKPLPRPINLMKMEDADDILRLIYDDELCLPTNRLPFKKWQKEINSSIEIGSRIVWSWSVDWEPSKYRSHRYLRYYSNEYAIPDPPKEGVYTVEEAKHENNYWEGGERKNKTEKYLCFKYAIGGDYWTWNGYKERKNRTSFCICREDNQVLHYDSISLDDIEFYLHSRIDRPNYLEFIPLLKTLKKHLLAEQEQEDQFCLMLIGECQKRGLEPKKGLYYEDIIMELIGWWKCKNKWKRPIAKDDELAMKMIERRLFAVSNKRKWFK